MHHHKLRGKEPDGCGAGAADRPQLEATSPESGEGSLCHHQHGPRQVKGSGGACRSTALLTGTTASPSDEEEEGTAPGSVCGLRPCSPKNTVLHLGVDGLCQTTGSPCSLGSSCSRLARSSFPHTWVPPGRPRPQPPHPPGAAAHSTQQGPPRERAWRPGSCLCCPPAAAVGPVGFGQRPWPVTPAESSACAQRSARPGSEPRDGIRGSGGQKSQGG